MKKFAYSMMIAALGGSLVLSAEAQTGRDSTKLGSLSLGKIKTSEQKAAASRLSVYPNPASRSIEITLHVADNKGFTLELFDNLGMRLLYQEWKSGTLDVSPYPSGVYLLTLRRDKESHTQKLLIQR